MPLRFVWPLLAAVLGFALGGSLVWGLQQPVPHERQQPTITNQTDENSGRTPADLGSEQYDEKGKQESQWYDKFREHITDWLLVLFNAILAAFTVRLFYATNGLVKAAREQSTDMKASIAVAGQSASAAKQSADVAERAFEQTYAPYVDVSVKPDAVVHRLIGGALSTQFMSGTTFAEYILHNYGNSPAIILEIYPGCVDSPIIPDQIPFPPPHTNLQQVIVVGGMKESAPQTVGYPTGWGSATNNIWLMLQIRYRDIFRDQYISNFCFFFNRSRATFGVVGGPKYNNRRKLTDEELKIAEERGG